MLKIIRYSVPEILSVSKKTRLQILVSNPSDAGQICFGERLPECVFFSSLGEQDAIFTSTLFLSQIFVHSFFFGNVTRGKA